MTQIAAMTVEAAIMDLPRQTPAIWGRYLSIGAAVWIVISASAICTNAMDNNQRAMLAGEGMLTSPIVTAR